MASRAGVDDACGADGERLSPIAVDVPAHDEFRLAALDAVADRAATADFPGRVVVDGIEGGRVDDQHAARFAPFEEGRRLVFVEVVTPVAERGHRDPAADAPEGNAIDFAPFAVQDAGGGPSPGGETQLVGRLAVAGDEDGGFGDLGEEVEGLGEPFVFGREVTGADQDVGFGRLFDERGGGGAITMEVAKTEQFHRGSSLGIGTSISCRLTVRVENRWELPSAGLGANRRRVILRHTMSRSTRDDREPSSRFGRRTVVLVLAIGLLVGSVGLRVLDDESSNVFASMAMARIGLVLGAVWLAWDSLRRPARWLPPGVAVAGLLGIAAIASQPRLAVVVIPALTALIVLGTFIRAVKR